jgi:hypothetical protein
VLEKFTSMKLSTWSKYSQPWPLLNEPHCVGLAVQPVSGTGILNSDMNYLPSSSRNQGDSNQSIHGIFGRLYKEVKPGNQVNVRVNSSSPSLSLSTHLQCFVFFVVCLAYELFVSTF